MLYPAQEEIIYRTVSCLEDAEGLALSLVGAAIPFHVQPRPDASWLFSTKAEHRRVLDDILDGRDA